MNVGMSTGSLRERLPRLRALVSPPLSARELASLAGIAGSHVSLIESGDKENPSPKTLQAICVVLGVSMDWLYAGVGEEPSSETVNEAVASARARFADAAGARS